jgi:hypothetical protein
MFRQIHVISVKGTRLEDMCSKKMSLHDMQLLSRLPALQSAVSPVDFNVIYFLTIFQEIHRRG